MHFKVTNIKKKIIIFSFCCSSFSFSVFFFWTFIFHCVKKCNATVLDSDICVFVAFKSVARAYNREEKTRRRKKNENRIRLFRSLCWIDIFKKKCDFLFLPMKKKTHTQPKRNTKTTSWIVCLGENCRLSYRTIACAVYFSQSTNGAEIIWYWNCWRTDVRTYWLKWIYLLFGRDEEVAK